MRLTDLDPEWVYDFKPDSRAMRRANDGVHVASLGSRDINHSLPSLSIANAQGVLFLCPACFKKNGGPVGTESILCWFKDRGVPDSAEPGPGRWTVSGSDFGNLTLSPSVNVNNEHWHGFIQNGEVK